MSDGSKKPSTSQWRDAVKMSNLKSSANKTNDHSGAVRPEWRRFTPREKAFILSAISNCASGKDVENVLRDYSGAVEYMQAKRGLPPATLFKF